MPPDGGAGVSGLARLGSDVFLAVYTYRCVASDWLDHSPMLNLFVNTVV